MGSLSLPPADRLAGPYEPGTLTPCSDTETGTAVNDSKKERILVAGLEVMHRQGYNGTGVKDIVDAAGIPKGSFYTYFESKEDFALKALDHFAGGSLSAGTAQCLDDRNVPPRQRIERLFEGMIEAYCSDGKFTCGCFIGNLSTEMADTSEPIRRKSEALFETAKNALRQCIGEGQRAGEIPPGQDPDLLAEFIWNSWEGAIMGMKSSKSAKPLQAFREVALKHLLG